MNESLFLKLSLVVTVIGLVSLYLISRQIEISDTTIEKIYKEEISGKVQVTGEVVDVKQSEKFTMLVINQISEIKAIAFDNISVNKGNVVEVTGRIEDEQIVVDSIKVS